MVDWINISTNSGSGNATITVTASSYSQLLERSTSLTVRTATKSAVVGITQRFNSSFTVSPATISAIPYSGASYSITVTANEYWMVNSPTAWWYSLSSYSGGSGTTVLTLTVQANDGDERSDSFIFTSGNISRTLTFTQVAYESEITPITFYPQVINIHSSGGSQEISIIYDGWWALSLDEGMWAEVSPYSDDPQHASGHGNTTLTITAEPNTGNTSRTVEIWACSNDDCASGTVVQEGYYVEPSGSITPSTITGSCIQNTTQIQITSNVSWTLEAPNWVYLSQSSGMSGNSITVSLTMFKNASSARSSTIILKSGNTVLDTASISQAEYTTQTFGHNSTIIRATSGGTYCATFPEAVSTALAGDPMLDYVGHIQPSNPWPSYPNDVSTVCWGITADTKNVYYETTEFYTRYPSNSYPVYIAVERSGCQDRLVTTAVYNVSQGENALFRANPAIIDSVSIDGNSVALTDLLDMTTETYDYDVDASDIATFGYNLSSGRHTVIITSIAPIQFWKIGTLQSVTLSGSCVSMSTPPVVGGQFYVSKVYTESFYGCSNLQSVTLDITDSSCVVEKSCKLPSFCLCTSLTNITIPSTITEVDGDSFVDSGIVRIYLQGTIAPSITGHALHRLPQSGVIHAPTNADYYSYANWESQLPDGWSIVYDL